MYVQTLPLPFVMVATSSVLAPSAKSVSSIVSGRMPSASSLSTQSFSPETVTVEAPRVFVNV